ncbi:MAG TPA: universal stress protein, partial [Rudaea sp.]
MFNHILVPTDGSKLSEKAIRQAVKIAKKTNARITALHVVQKVHAYDYPLELMQRTAEELEQTDAEQAEQYLRFAQRVAHGSGVACEVMQTTSDKPYREIIKAAEKNGCDLILMASHGRRGIEGFLLG